MIINHNMSAIFTQRQLKFNNIATDKDMEKLSSGYRINRAGDELVVTATIENIRQAAGNDLLTTRADVATTAGEPVVTAYSVIVSRGTATEG